jgi:Skp family chaperone for outer membrane proteins
MKVLLTNNSLRLRAGTELYIRDLAIELMRRGHHPIAYSTKLGLVAEELRAAAVPVTETLDSLDAPPDIIHGHHHYETLTAILRFPETPAIYYCHGWIPWQEAPLRSRRIARYVAVDEISRERLISEGEIAPERIELLFNFFDARQFAPRTPLPSRPGLALAFGNGFSEQQEMRVLREACARRGIKLHSAGVGVGDAELDPGRRLAGYDVVFAKARAAIEAMAVGAAVVLCGYGRMGPLVTAANFASLRRQNFGLCALSRPLDVDGMVSELDRYNAEGAAEVAGMTREICELQPAVDRIVDLYGRVIEEARRDPVVSAATVCRDAGRYLEEWAPCYTYALNLVPVRERWEGIYAAVESRLGARSHHDGVETAMLEAWANLAARQSELDALRRDLDQMERLLAEAGADRAARQSEIDALRRDLDQMERLLAEAGADRAARRSEIDALRRSAARRWCQRMLNHALVRGIFGRLIRTVAESSGGARGK